MNPSGTIAERRRLSKRSGNLDALVQGSKMMIFGVLNHFPQYIFARFEIEGVLHTDSAGTHIFQLRVRQREIESLLLSVHPFAIIVVDSNYEGDRVDIEISLLAKRHRSNEVRDLGTDVAPEKFVQAVQETNAHVLCLSPLLTVTMPAMKTTITALENAGLRQQVKVLVGGAPGTSQYAQQIGADAYGENANSAVTLARKMVARGAPWVSA